MVDLSELTPEAQELSSKLRKRRVIELRKPVLDRIIAILIAIIFVTILILGAWVWASNATEKAASERQDVVIAQIQDDLKDVCRKVSTDSLAPSEKDSCYRAEQNIPPSVVTESKEPSQPFLDASVLLDAAKVRVDDYLATHEIVSAAELLPIVQQVYAENKPADAPAPTDEQVFGILARIYAANPPAPGKDATQAQADAALQSYCDAEGSPCIGPKGDKGDTGSSGQDGATGADGKDGAPGRGIISRHYEWDPEDSTQCREVTEYNVEPTVQYIVVGPELCEGSSAPSTPESIPST